MIAALIFPLSLTNTGIPGSYGQEKKGNIIMVEAETFFMQEKNELRSWVKIRSAGKTDTVAEKASGKQYIQCQPDTRVTKNDKLINGENFTNNPGEMAVISYKIKVKQPGRYYVWASCYSTGAEDNGVHVGLNGQWPESGKRMQWCEGKNRWTWASRQRTEAVHCGEPYLIYLDIEKPGQHILHFSMREDGFRMDRILLTTDKTFIPTF
jgi:hypothetical protein